MRAGWPKLNFVVVCGRKRKLADKTLLAASAMPLCVIGGAQSSWPFVVTAGDERRPSAWHGCRCANLMSVNQKRSVVAERMHAYRSKMYIVA